MRRFLTILSVGLVGLALLLNGAPASAASTSWTDPEGDATLYLDVEAPRPSEPAYDVLNVAIASDGKDLTVVSKFKQLGTVPPQATGNTYRFVFVAGEGTFTLSVIQDQLAGEFSTFAVRDATTGVNTATECIKCTGKMNLESNTIELKMPISALDSARRTAGVAGKIAPGSNIESVNVIAGEYYNFGYRVPGVTDTAGTGGVSLSNEADSSPLPAPGTFTL